MNTKLCTRLSLAIVAVTLISGCDSLTEREEDVTINLDSFNLVGTSAGSIQTRAVVTGNPGCTASESSINQLLATAENFDDIDEYLESLDIQAVRYRIRNNVTPVDISGLFQMTAPGTSEQTTVASVNIPANTNVDDWTELPFVDNGASTAEHYMDNRDNQFSYCVEGTPNSSDISLTMELQLDLVVTIDLL